MKINEKLNLKTIGCCVLATFLTAMSCEDDMTDGYIRFYNHSGEVLYTYKTFGSDSIMPQDFTFDPRDRIGIDMRTGFGFNNPDMEDGRKFDLLIFKQSTLDQYGWEQIRQQNLYDKRFFVDLDSLTQLDFKLKYYGE